jgi:hypothetical protein
VPHPDGAGVYRRMRGFSLAGVEEDADEPRRAGEGKRDYWAPSRG